MRLNFIHRVTIQWQRENLLAILNIIRMWKSIRVSIVLGNLFNLDSAFILLIQLANRELNLWYWEKICSQIAVCNAFIDYNYQRRQTTDLDTKFSFLWENSHFSLSLTSIFFFSMSPLPKALGKKNSKKCVEYTYFLIFPYFFIT